MTANGHMSDSQKQGKQYPGWMVVLVVLIIASAHTQLTMRHLALRLANVRYGDIAKEDVAATPDGMGTICRDPYAVFKPHELQGKKLWIGDQFYPITDNTPTEIHLDAAHVDVTAAFAEKDRHRSYLTGFTEKTVVIKAALACPSINFTPSDCLLGLSFGLLFLYFAIKRQRPARMLPPMCLAVFLLVCVLSLFDWARILDGSGMSAERNAGIKELIQYAEVWLLGYLFFVEVLRDRRIRRAAVVTLVVAGGVTIVVGLWEYTWVVRGATQRLLADIGEVDALFGIRFNPSRSTSAGSESSRNVLAGYLMIFLPLLVALLPAVRSRRSRVVLCIIACLGISCLLHGAMLVAAVGGCLLVTLNWKKTSAVPATIGLVFLIILLTCIISRRHGAILIDSVALNRTQDTYGLQPMPMKGQGLESVKAWEPWQQKYLELQAALNAISFSPLFGYGLGMYQRRINLFFTSSKHTPLTGVIKKPKNFMERDSHSVFAVQAVETGLIGVACLLWLLVWIMQQALRVRSRADDPFDRALLLGVAGSVMAILIGGWFTSVMVRGLQLVVIAISALPAAVAAEEKGE